MATKRWEGGAALKTDTRTYAFGGTWETDDLVRLQVGNKIIDITAGSTTTATVVTNVVAAIAALDAADYPEITGETGFTASGNSTTLTLTANTPGVPFICTLTPLEANGGSADSQTIAGGSSATTGTATVTNAGPEVWGTAANWDTGTVPVAADTVIVERTEGSILYDLSQAGATLISLNIPASFTGTLGLPKLNDTDGEYPEYRTEYLTIDATTVRIGQGEGDGSGRIKINAGTVQTAVWVYSTGTPIDADLPAFIWKGTHANNTMKVLGGSVGVAIFNGETATLTTLEVRDGEVRCGSGCTLGTVTVHGGDVTIASNVTNLYVYGGTVTTVGEVSVSNLYLYSGTVRYNATGDISNAIIGQNGYLDLSGGIGSVGLDNPIEAYGPNPVNDPLKRFGNDLIIDFNGQTPYDAYGTNVRLTRGTPA